MKQNQYNLTALPLVYYPGLTNPQLENSNKVILPQKILDSLLTQFGDSLQYPIIFKISVNFLDFYVGVEEFSSNNDIVYIPNHIIQTNLIELHQSIILSYCSPPKGSFIKLQPHKTKFTETTNFKDNLEDNLNKYYPVLAKNATISLYDAKTNQSYLVDIVECEPSHVIVTNNIDLTVDFAEPKDYQTIQRQRKKETEELRKIQREIERKEREEVQKRDQEKKEAKKQQRMNFRNREINKKIGTFVAFTGKGNRLGGS